MDEYVDVWSDQYTRYWKILGMIRFSIKMILSLMFAIMMILLVEGLAPYIKGEEIWDEMPFTLSQLEAIFSLLVMYWLCSKTMKVINKW